MIESHAEPAEIILTDMTQDANVVSTTQLEQEFHHDVELIQELIALSSPILGTNDDKSNK